MGGLVGVATDALEPLRDKGRKRKELRKELRGDPRGEGVFVLTEAREPRRDDPPPSPPPRCLSTCNKHTPNKRPPL